MESRSYRKYKLPKKGIELTTDELIDMWSDIVDRYPIFSIEDPLDEEDWDGWKKITEKLGRKIHLVGDDLFVTKCREIKKGNKREMCKCNIDKTKSDRKYNRND